VVSDVLLRSIQGVAGGTEWIRMVVMCSRTTLRRNSIVLDSLQIQHVLNPHCFDPSVACGICFPFSIAVLKSLWLSYEVCFITIINSAVVSLNFDLVITIVPGLSISQHQLIICFFVQTCPLLLRVFTKVCIIVYFHEAYFSKNKFTVILSHIRFITALVLDVGA
jgi:hypothetical protein